jgi:hypothetical protein
LVYDRLVPARVLKYMKAPRSNIIKLAAAKKIPLWNYFSRRRY